MQTNRNVAAEQDSNTKNQTDTRDMQTTTSIQDLIGGEEKAQEIKNEVTKPDRDRSGKGVEVESTLVEDEVSPTKNPATVPGSNVEGNKNSYTIP